VIALSGLQAPYHRFLGGLRDGSEPAPGTGDSLYLFAPVKDGRWDPAVLPDVESVTDGRPTPRKGHTVLDMNSAAHFGKQVYFGGREASNTPKNDTWFLRRDPNLTGADYRYVWEKKNLTSPPRERSDHTAVLALDNMMVVYGGLDNENAPRSDVWRFFFNAATPGYEWRQVATSGTAPAARCGHAAVYDASVSGVRRMIVFGGANGPNATATDSSVWELRWDDPQDADHASWHAMPLASRPNISGRPGPRFWPRLVYDAAPRLAPATGGTSHVALMYGGRRNSTTYEDTLLWKLWLLPGDSVLWQPVTIAGPGPGGRARHSAVYDPGQGMGNGVPGGRLYLLGGTTASGAADKYVYVVDPWAASPAWSKWAQSQVSLAGQSAQIERGSGFARTPDIYSPSTGQWQALASPLWQPFYPPTFLVPGGAGKSRMVSFGFGQTFWLDVPATGSAGNWQMFPNGVISFRPHAAVTYRPGRLMTAGGAINVADVVGTTKILDTGNTSNAWDSLSSMAPREHHNLVLLANGQVLAVGGTTSWGGHGIGAAGCGAAAATLDPAQRRRRWRNVDQHGWRRYPGAPAAGARLP